MTISSYFPIWDQLTARQQQLIESSLLSRSVKKGEIVHNGSADCAGLMLIGSGQLRAYMLSADGREMTLYRLFEMDICLFSASCVMSSVQFEMMIEAEKDSQLLILPPHIYRQVLNESAAMANYTNEIMASRFSEVMWLMEQIMWKSFDKRLAAFLLEEAALEDSPSLKITHETIGNHLGNPREVVTRMLRYFQSEGMVSLSRGTVEITDEKKLRKLTQ